ncbi:MAG: TA system VapC family ribonuclease toxin [Gemmatimonadaceae bacterium]
MKLVDTNLLLYAIDKASVHHAATKKFLEQALSAEETLALPWAVITGFIRLSTNRRVTRRPIDPKAASAIVDGWLAFPNVVALDPGPDHWRIMRELIEATGVGGNLINDAHLAAMAIENGAELCSADSDFARFPRLKWTDPTRG